MGVMEILSSAGSTVSDCWNGSNKMFGNYAGTVAETLAMGGINIGDGKSVAAKVNAMTGADKEKEGSGNLGNKIGTVLGGLAGLALGPTGVAGGAMLGSTAGGWIANMLGGGEEAAKNPSAAPAAPAPTPAAAPVLAPDAPVLAPDAPVARAASPDMVVPKAMPDDMVKNLNDMVA